MCIFAHKYTKSINTQHEKTCITYQPSALPFVAGTGLQGLHVRRQGRCLRRRDGCIGLDERRFAALRRT